MLNNKLPTKLLGANIYKNSLFPIFHNRCLFSPARHLFDQIPTKNFQFFCLFSNDSYQQWNNTSVPSNPYEVLAYFCRINGSGTKPTKYNLCSSLNSCAKTLNLHLGLQIHALIIQIGYDQNLFLNSALVDLYSKCDSMADAKKVFGCMENHDQVSWTSIIHGFVQNGCGKVAINMFKDMLSTQIRPNCFSYVSVIRACLMLQEPFEQVTLIHSHVIKLGFDSNNFVVCSLIDCYSKCGKIDEAKVLFDAGEDSDIVIVNSMISGFLQNLYYEEALRLFMGTRNDDVMPTDHTLTSILNACGSLAVLQCGKQVHSLLIKMGSEVNMFVVSSLLDMYSKCGSIDEARRVFDQTAEKNSVMLTSMITAYAQSGKSIDGLELFDRLAMKEEKFAPDHVCFTAVLTACNHAGLLDKGIGYFDKMRRDFSLVPQLDQYSCLIDLYAKNGHLTKATKLIEQMPFDPNCVILSSFLSSCKDYGEVELGKEAANQLFQMEPCNAAHYVTLANLFAKAGLWDDVAEIRKMSREKGTKKRTGWSWIEVGRRVHVFSADDSSHPRYQDIYLELEKLNFEMKDLRNMPKPISLFDDV